MLDLAEVFKEVAVSDNRVKETTGAWVIHHGRKVALDTSGAAEFPVIDEAAKAANLLAKLGETNQVILKMEEVKAVAVASGLNPRHELSGLLAVLERKRLVEQSDEEVAVLGITTRGALRHAADLFEEAEPSPYERASIDLAELVSQAPIRRTEVEELIGDRHFLPRAHAKDFLDRSEQIGFVDMEGDGKDRLLFNGNLFRRDTVSKTLKVLTSLSNGDQRLMREVDELLARRGCVEFTEVEQVLAAPLFEKVRAAGLYDLNVVANDAGEHVYVTSPGAFHKFVDPLVDDCFDMAKALVSALAYGMTKRSPYVGRIFMLDALLGKLIRGSEIGPATAIGEDYRVLEVNRVVKLRRDPQHPNRFRMRLLKREVGELALQVLTTGDASAQSLKTLPAAPMTGYLGPEDMRVRTRKKQSRPSRKSTHDVLEAVRGGRDFR